MLPSLERKKPSNFSSPWKSSGEVPPSRTQAEAASVTPKGSSCLFVLSKIRTVSG